MSSKENVVDRFTRYLNGPMGKTVLEDLDEGESFMLQTNEFRLKISKEEGVAVVRVVDVPSQ